MAHEYPVGKAQWMVLRALGKTAGSYQEAERIFERIGIAVGHQRVGRSVVPVVSLLARTETASGFNAGGDADEFTYTRTFEPCDLTPLQQWMA